MVKVKFLQIHKTTYTKTEKKVFHKNNGQVEGVKVRDLFQSSKTSKIIKVLVKHRNKKVYVMGKLNNFGLRRDSMQSLKTKP